MGLEDNINQIYEYIDIAGEYSLAYEKINGLLDNNSFKLSGLNCVRLFEAGLLLGFKTDADKDRIFDHRDIFHGIFKPCFLSYRQNHYSAAMVTIMPAGWGSLGLGANLVALVFFEQGRRCWLDRIHSNTKRPRHF